MGVQHTVRKTLATLLVGVVWQRLLQLAAFVCIGRGLGAEQLGVYAQGLAVAALLSVLAGAGVRNLLARAVAQRPAAAGVLIARAVRTRLAVGSCLGATAIGVAFASSASPWFWTLCVLHVLPAAFDLKSLLDATGRARAEVVFESATALLNLLLVVAWLWCGGDDLVTLAAISLVARSVYALLAVPAILRLPRERSAAAAPDLASARGTVAGQTLHELISVGDTWLVALCFGDAAAGLYAVAVRFAAAALLPSAQLARLLLPHTLHAAAAGDAARTLATAARVTMLVTLPMLAGGAAVAQRLCSLPGAEFAAAAPALILALLGGCLQHGGWQRSHALLAAGRDAAYARTFGWPALLQVSLTCAAGWLLAARDVAVTDAATAALAAAIGAIAQTVYFAWSNHAVRDLTAARPRAPLTAPLLVAGATWGAAAAPGFCITGPTALPLQLLTGAAAFAIGVWLVELRGRLDRVGDGLATASGFRA